MNYLLTLHRSVGQEMQWRGREGLELGGGKSVVEMFLPGVDCWRTFSLREILRMNHEMAGMARM